MSRVSRPAGGEQDLGLGPGPLLWSTQQTVATQPVCVLRGVGHTLFLIHYVVKHCSLSGSSLTPPIAHHVLLCGTFSMETLRCFHTRNMFIQN